MAEIPIAVGGSGRLTGDVFAKKSNGAIIIALITAVFLWGASNAGTKFVVAGWPPIWVGCTRFLGAGVIMLAILRWTSWLGPLTPLTPEIGRGLWFRGGLSLALYIVVFNWALKLTAASHVSLYLGASPVWALLWEERPTRTWHSAQRYGAAALAASGVIVLFWPALRSGNSSLPGEILGLTAGILWTVFGRQSRRLSKTLSGAEVSAHTMFRAGMLLLPLALVEMIAKGLVWRTDYALVQGYCAVGGGVIAYALWNNALRHWPTSQVFLFNNLVPLSTMAWAWACLGEPITPTFWMAMILIALGVVLGQGNWQKVLGNRWAPME